MRKNEPKPNATDASNPMDNSRNKFLFPLFI